VEGLKEAKKALSIVNDVPRGILTQYLPYESKTLPTSKRSIILLEIFEDSSWKNPWSRSPIVQFGETFIFCSKCHGKVGKGRFAKDYFACLFGLRNNANSNGKEYGSCFLKKRRLPAVTSPVRFIWHSPYARVRQLNPRNPLLILSGSLRQYGILYSIGEQLYSISLT
jgi:hypothetical protein